MSFKRAKSAHRVATDDVRTMGGKELVLNRLVNHYKALSNVKPKVIIQEPPKHVDRFRENGKKINQKQGYLNVRQTYKAVANVKSIVDANKPFTFKMGKSQKQSAKEKFEDFEHIRRLSAMSKRIVSLGKPHERKKNINDPIANPTYFFRKPGDDKAIKLVSLQKFNQKLNELNNEERNKKFLGEAVYNTLGTTGFKSAKHSENLNKSMLRPHTASYTTPKNNDFKKTSKEKNKIYTHIHTDPLEIIKQHVQERMKNTQTDKIQQEDLLNMTKNTNKLTMNMNNTMNTMKSYQPNITDQKVTFPLFDNSQENPKENFKIKIVKFIIYRRIYKESDMEMLLKQLIHKNKNYIPEEEIREVFDLVKKELDE